MPVKMNSSKLPSARTATPMMQPVMMRVNFGVTRIAPVL